MENQKRPAPPLSAFIVARRAVGQRAMLEHDRRELSAALRSAVGVVSKATAALGIHNRNSFYAFARGCDLDIAQLRAEIVAEAAAARVAAPSLDGAQA